MLETDVFLFFIEKERIAHSLALFYHFGKSRAVDKQKNNQKIDLLFL